MNNYYDYDNDEKDDYRELIRIHYISIFTVYIIKEKIIIITKLVLKL